MTVFDKISKGVAFVLSPTAYMLNKKAKQGKVKSTAKQFAKGFKQGVQAPARAVQGKSPLPKGRRKGNHHNKTHNKNGKKKPLPVKKPRK